MFGGNILSRILICGDDVVLKWFDVSLGGDLKVWCMIFCEFLLI